MKTYLIRLFCVITLLSASLLLSSPVAHAQSSASVTNQRGDTLAKIARRSGGNPSSVYDRGPRTGATGSFNSPNYAVAWGDELDSIAARFGVSTTSIRQLNDLWGGTISVGMNLVIPGMSNNPPANPGVERVRFTPGSVSATRSGTIARGGEKYYVLGASAGQRMEIYTSSQSEPLAITVTNPNGVTAIVNGTNSAIQNSVWITLPQSGDFMVTVAPANAPAARSIHFDITFVIH
jgi:LysM repeat protein